ncbi:hypothetical protein OIU84_016927 [Salix udensis]|uniref:Uncharacterized protein n=1 Tax=Salix udensis TaxID=889485 RepID=A0AAD6JAL8_9ROSI|nr:hypothetical protein OIU84_016927 [Salix udensis]
MASYACSPEQSFVMWLASLGRKASHYGTSSRHHLGKLRHVNCAIVLMKRTSIFSSNVLFRPRFGTMSKLGPIFYGQISGGRTYCHGSCTGVKKKDSISNYIGSLAFTSNAYHLWQERNEEDFSKHLSR